MKQPICSTFVVGNVSHDKQDSSPSVPNNSSIVVADPKLVFEPLTSINSDLSCLSEITLPHCSEIEDPLVGSIGTVIPDKPLSLDAEATSLAPSQGADPHSSETESESQKTLQDTQVEAPPASSPSSELAHLPEQLQSLLLNSERHFATISELLDRSKDFKRKRGEFIDQPGDRTLLNLQGVEIEDGKLVIDLNQIEKSLNEFSWNHTDTHIRSFITLVTEKYPVRKVSVTVHSKSSFDFVNSSISTAESVKLTIFDPLRRLQPREMHSIYKGLEFSDQTREISIDAPQFYTNEASMDVGTKTLFSVLAKATNLKTLQISSGEIPMGETAPLPPNLESLTCIKWRFGVSDLRGFSNVRSLRLTDCEITPLMKEGFFGEKKDLEETGRKLAEMLLHSDSKIVELHLPRLESEIVYDFLSRALELKKERSTFNFKANGFSYELKDNTYSRDAKRLASRLTERQ